MATHGFGHQCLWASGIHQSHALLSEDKHFYNRQLLVFHLLKKKAGTDAFSSLAFPWHSDEMCLILSHRKHCCSQPNLCTPSDSSCHIVSCHMVRPRALVKDNCTTALYSRGNFCIWVRLSYGCSSRHLAPPSSVMIALTQVRSGSTFIASIREAA